MEWVWLSAPDEVTVRDVAEQLSEYAYTTIATLLDRLVKKGVLRLRSERHTKYYRPIGNSGAHTAVLMHEALAADLDQTSALRQFVAGLDEAQATIVRDALIGDRDPP